MLLTVWLSFKNYVIAKPKYLYIVRLIHACRVYIAVCVCQSCLSSQLSNKLVHNYQAETSPMVRDDDDVAPELRRRRGVYVVNHSSRINLIICFSFCLKFLCA